MALIKCSECGKDVSTNAGNCPNCGNPIGNKKVNVHFERKRNMLNAVAVTGTVLVDGVVVGSAGNGTSFDVMLTVGNHSITIDSKTTGMMASGRSASTNLNIPENAKEVIVTLKPKNDAMSFLSGGMKVMVDDIQIIR